MKDPIILIDANSIGARAVFTVGNLSFQEMPTGVIYGFLKEVQRIFEEFKTNRICFFWDAKASLRKLFFPNYKVKRSDNRTQREKDVWIVAHEQYDLLRDEILPSIGWKNQFYADGFEADDLLAQAVSQLPWNEKLIMVTTDEDMYQCLQACDIYNQASKKVITTKTFEDKYGIKPERWAEVKSIAGCKSDEVPGIVGVGEKTAIKFLNGELKRTTKAYQNIVCPNGTAIIHRNRQLVTLPFKDTPTLRFQKNELSLDNFVQICEKYGMVSLLGHYSLRSWEDTLK